MGFGIRDYRAYGTLVRPDYIIKSSIISTFWDMFNDKGYLKSPVTSVLIYVLLKSPVTSTY